MARINVEFGQGGADFVADLRAGQLWSFGLRGGRGNYEIDLGAHGGRQYYWSRSGLSGAGWLPASPWLKKVQGYRTDCGNLAGLPYWGDDVYGHEIFVPYDYRQSRRDDDWPIVIRRKADGAIFLTGLWGYPEILEYGEDGCEEREVAIRYLPQPDAEEHILRVTVFLHRTAPKGHVRQVVEALYYQSLEFQWDEAGREPANPFWSRLGLYPHGGKAYKISRGVCRGYLPFGEDGSWSAEALQEWAPSNVAVLDRNVYIQGEGDRWEALALFDIDGQAVDYELHLEPAEALRAVRGDSTEVWRRLWDGAMEKFNQWREWEARQRASQLADEELLPLASQTPSSEGEDSANRAVPSL